MLVDDLNEVHNHPRSAVVIARLLNADSFSDEIVVKVWDYFLHTSITRKQRHAHLRHREYLKHLTADLGKQEKKALGKFIANIARAHLDTGLRIGLTAFAFKNEEPPINKTIVLLQCEQKIQEDMLDVYLNADPVIFYPTSGRDDRIAFHMARLVWLHQLLDKVTSQ